jgi:hypothetical protein
VDIFINALLAVDAGGSIAWLEPNFNLNSGCEKVGRFNFMDKGIKV